MDNKKNHLCEKIHTIKTSILVIEETKEIGDKLTDCLKLRHINANVKSKKIKNTVKIKPYDIYVINSSSYSQEDKFAIVKRILCYNSQANIFLLNDVEEEKININAHLGNYAHIFKAGEAISEILPCAEKGLEIILETIQMVENTKKKLHDLWTKLERTI